MIGRFPIALSALVVLASALMAFNAHAQPYGLGSGTMMGPGMMARGGFGRMCSPAGLGFVEWRIDRLDQMLKPTDAQRSKFDEFKTASTKAAEIVRNACPTDFPATATGRMEAMEKRMEAMLQAIKTVRPSLESFYATLSEEQKARLNSSDGRGRFWRWRSHW